MVHFVAPLDQRHGVVVAECVQRLVCCSRGDIAIVVSSPGVGKGAALTGKAIGTACIFIIFNGGCLFQRGRSFFGSIERIVQCSASSDDQIFLLIVFNRDR